VKLREFLETEKWMLLKIKNNFSPLRQVIFRNKENFNPDVYRSRFSLIFEQFKNECDNATPYILK